MATTAASREEKTVLRVPPPEKFWKRYSPHGEAPLSLAGSVAVHLLAGGGMLLMGMLLASAFFSPPRSLPVEPVRLDLGGGGGKKSGVGDTVGVGSGAVATPDGMGEDTTNYGDEPTERPSLTPVETKNLEKFDPDTVRKITESKSGAQFARLDEALRAKLAPVGDGVAGKGLGGEGSGGGKDRGKGTGEGSSTGSGKLKLTQREKRMLRWHMGFTARTGPEYVAQLRSLGAILAIPIREAPEPVYKIIRDLRPGAAKLLDEDISRIQRIYWIDDKPGSVRDVLAALGLPLQPLPSRFIAFMPESLEKKLYDMEKQYITRVLRLPFNEDKIDETNFSVIPVGDGFVPKVAPNGVKLRR